MTIDLDKMKALVEGEDLEEATTSYAPSMIRKAIHMLDSQMKARAKKYDADQAQVTGSAHGIQVRLWINGEDEEEARDVAKLFLGSGYSLEPHKLKKNYYVATVVYTLADIF